MSNEVRPRSRDAGCFPLGKVSKGCKCVSLLAYYWDIAVLVLSATIGHLRMSVGVTVKGHSPWMEAPIAAIGRN
jgi:hypothetical protein